MLTITSTRVARPSPASNHQDHHNALDRADFERAVGSVMSVIVPPIRYGHRRVWRWLG